MDDERNLKTEYGWKKDAIGIIMKNERQLGKQVKVDVFLH